MKFRQKPVVIEAFQMTEERRQSNVDWPEWLHAAWNMSDDDIGSVYPEHYPHSDGKDRLKIRTLEGAHLVSWDDWIIRGVTGELYPVKDEIFRMTYEAVAEKEN